MLPRGPSFRTFAAADLSVAGRTASREAPNKYNLLADRRCYRLLPLQFVCPEGLIGHVFFHVHGTIRRVQPLGVRNLMAMAASLGAKYSDRTADRVLAGYDFRRQTPFSLGQTGRQSSERSAMTIEVREALNAPPHDTVPQNRYPTSNRMLPTRLSKAGIRCKLQDRASKRTWDL